MKPRVGVCTLPIDLRFHDLLNPEHLKPTSLSMKRRTLAASTKSILMLPGFSIASLTAVLVISLKVTRFSTGNSENRILRRQAMNSPSRSGSVARYTSSTPDSVALFRIVAMTLSAPSVHSQGGSGRSPFFEAHIALERFLPPPPCGRSCMWPEQASTIHPLPRYFFTVRALAPDSRINNFIVPSLRQDYPTGDNRPASFRCALMGPV